MIFDPYGTAGRISRPYFPFRCGERVVCINDTLPDPVYILAWFREWPTAGRVYTVRDTMYFAFPGPTFGVTLRENRNPENTPNGGEYGYLASRFCKLLGAFQEHQVSSRRQRVRPGILLP